MAEARWLCKKVEAGREWSDWRTTACSCIWDMSEASIPPRGLGGGAAGMEAEEAAADRGGGGGMALVAVIDDDDEEDDDIEDDALT